MFFHADNDVRDNAFGWGGEGCCRSLALDGCYLKGTLPDTWSVLDSLQSLSLSNNAFTGTIPGAWTTMTGLRYDVETLCPLVS